MAERRKIAMAGASGGASVVETGPFAMPVELDVKANQGGDENHGEDDNQSGERTFEMCKVRISNMIRKAIRKLFFKCCKKKQ